MGLGKWGIIRIFEVATEARRIYFIKNE